MIPQPIRPGQCGIFQTAPLASGLGGYFRLHHLETVGCRKGLPHYVYCQLPKGHEGPHEDNSHEGDPYLSVHRWVQGEAPNGFCIWENPETSATASTSRHELPEGYASPQAGNNTNGETEKGIR